MIEQILAIIAVVAILIVAAPLLIIDGIIAFCRLVEYWDDING